MSTDSSAPLGVDGIDARRLHPVVKVLLVAAGLGVLWLMVTSLPGLDELVPVQPVPVSALLGGTVTLGIVAALAYAAVALQAVLEGVLSGPRELVADAAAMAKHVVLFVALLVAYDGFGPILVPTLEAAGLEWVYHLTFLALALVPTVVIAECIYHDVDEVAGLLTSRLADSNDADAN